MWGGHSRCKEGLKKVLTNHAPVMADMRENPLVLFGGGKYDCFRGDVCFPADGTSFIDEVVREGHEDRGDDRFLPDLIGMVRLRRGMTKDKCELCFFRTAGRG